VGPKTSALFDWGLSRAIAFFMVWWDQLASSAAGPTLRPTQIQKGIGLGADMSQFLELSPLDHLDGQRLLIWFKKTKEVETL